MDFYKAWAIIENEYISDRRVVELLEDREILGGLYTFLTKWADDNWEKYETAQQFNSAYLELIVETIKNAEEQK